jgi:hypothetical protein
LSRMRYAKELAEIIGNWSTEKASFSLQNALIYNRFITIPIPNPYNK